MMCKQCGKELKFAHKNRRYCPTKCQYQKYRTKILKQKKEYHKKNQKEILEKKAVYRAKIGKYELRRRGRKTYRNNIEENRKKNREYYYDNWDVLKDYRDNRKDEIRDVWKKYSKENRDDLNKKSRAYHKLEKENENNKRIELSKKTGIRIPLIGENSLFVSETKLFALIKHLCPYPIERNKRFKWLGRQSLDIYLKEKRIAIEYDGIQHEHYFPMFHRNLDGFFRKINNDKTKDKLCKENNVKLIRWSYKKEITEQNVLLLLNGLGLETNQKVI